jgi:hypothetical protein
MNWNQFALLLHLPGVWREMFDWAILFDSRITGDQLAIHGHSA